MKKILLFLLCCLTFSFASLPTKENIDTLVEEIKPPRSGLNGQLLPTIQSPFIMIKKGKEGKVSAKRLVSKKYRSSSRDYTQRTIHFKLDATLNKSAKINDRWISINHKIGGYTLKEISKEFVVLQKGKAEPITVYLNRKNQNIHLQTK